MSIAFSDSSKTIQELISNSENIHLLKTKLEVFGCDEETIEIQLKEFKKRKLVHRQTNGFICMIIGATLGFISCLMTVFNPIPEIYYWVLYGLTSIAILIIFLGLYFVFE